MRLILTASFLFMQLLSSAAALDGPTLDTISANGVIRCGVSGELPGFSKKDEAGHWQGFDIDLCRAVAAAALGQADKVTFVPVTSVNRFPVLLSGKIDLLLRNTTYTFEREAAIGVRFAGIYYYDGQAFMVSRPSGIQRLADLNGATVSFLRKTTHEANLKGYFQEQGLNFTPLPANTLKELYDNLSQGRCQALTADRAELLAIRSLASGGSEEFVILPDTISIEPLGPVVRKDDEEWLLLVKWVLYALIEAERLGITQANVRTRLETSPDYVTRAFLASDGLPEKTLGIRPGWVVRVIEAVGNYGEIFERNLGSQSGLKLERGLNRLWTQGGLMYAPPFR